MLSSDGTNNGVINARDLSARHAKKETYICRHRLKKYYITNYHNEA